VQDIPRLAAETADYRCTYLTSPDLFGSPGFSIRRPTSLFSPRVARGSKRWRAPQRPL